MFLCFPFPNKPHVGVFGKLSLRAAGMKTDIHSIITQNNRFKEEIPKELQGEDKADIGSGPPARLQPISGMRESAAFSSVTKLWTLCLTEEPRLSRLLLKLGCILTANEVVLCSWNTLVCCKIFMGSSASGYFLGRACWDKVHGRIKFWPWRL